MRRGLVGDHVRYESSAHDLGHHVGGVAEQADGHCLLVRRRRHRPAQRLVERRGRLVQVPRLDASADALGVDLDADRHTTVHRHRQRLGAAHAAEAGSEHDAPGERSAEVLLGGRGKGLVRALQDALGADVDPGAGGHLPVHGQAQSVEAAELVPRGPVGHEIGVGDQHSRRPRVRAEHANGLARLHQQRLVVAQPPQGGDDRGEALPVARRLADAAVDDQILRPLGDFRVEVVHQHAHRCFLLPSQASQSRASWGPYDARTGAFVHRSLTLPADESQATLTPTRIQRPVGDGRRSLRSTARRRRLKTQSSLLLDDPQREHDLAVVLVPDLRGRTVHRGQADEEAFPAGDLEERRTVGELAPGKQGGASGAVTRPAPGARTCQRAATTSAGPMRQATIAPVELVPDLGDGAVDRGEAHEDALPAGHLGQRRVVRPLATAEQARTGWSG